MSATTVTSQPTARPAVRRERAVHAPIPFRRLVSVEWRKMFDTRSGFWLLVAIAALAVIATGATLVFGNRDNLGYGSFASAVGVPITVILPVLGALSVSSEWGQRTALTTFTLVPSRGRVIAAKLVTVVTVGLASLVVALAAGAVGNLLNGAIIGHAPLWDVSWRTILQIVLVDQIGMLMGFMLGVLFRSSPGAIVGYFVYALVLPGVSGALASAQQWWADHAAWFDLRTASIPLYDSGVTGQEWAQLGVATLIWLVLPLAIGLRMLMRSEVK
ncbi:MAG: ABC transporter permease [Nocardioidaceae bacterium]|nr:ABC transporter permease [Nocardioidaceae bacterium]MCL2612612.1 ABC transporter permease [Nocardioidaceae bacterium]